jgi:hypothetical protein
MCYRLLVAVQSGPDLAALQSLGDAAGLDVRTAEQGPHRFVEVAWGDCACSLVTRREGKQRLTGWVRAVLLGGAELQLLLSQDGAALTAETQTADCSFADLEKHGLSTLSEGRVTRIHPGPTS